MSRIRVVALDDYQDGVRACGPWERLDGRIELVTFTEHIHDWEVLVDKLVEAEVVLAMRERTRIDRELIARLPSLRLLITKGMRNAAIDLEAAADHGVIVCGTENLRDPTAELTWALILALAKNLVVEHDSMQEGGWQRLLGRELEGATLGVIGLGRLGSKVARLGRAFGMDVIAWSKNLDPEEAASLTVRAVTKEELLRTADIVTLHLRLSERNRGVIGAKELAMMRTTALLINTSRGPLVDEAALLEALHSGSIAGAGLDVYDHEPLPSDHPLRSTPNTVLLPHVGFVTREAYEHHFTQVVEEIDAWLDGAPMRVIDGGGQMTERRTSSPDPRSWRPRE